MNLVIVGAKKDEVFLCLGLLKMVELANPVSSCDMMIEFDLKSM